MNREEMREQKARELQEKLIEDVITVAIQVNGVNTISKGETYVYSVEVVVSSLEDLNKFIRTLEKVRTITNVERVMQ